MPHILSKIKSSLFIRTFIQHNFFFFFFFTISGMYSLNCFILKIMALEQIILKDFKRFVGVKIGSICEINVFLKTSYSITFECVTIDSNTLQFVNFLANFSSSLGFFPLLRFVHCLSHLSEAFQIVFGAMRSMLLLVPKLICLQSYPRC